MDIQLPASYERTQMKRNTGANQPLKSYSPIMGISEFANYIGDLTGRDAAMGRTKHGAAQAYYIVSYVEKCVELISSGINSLPFIIKRFHRSEEVSEGEDWEGTIVAKSDDVNPRHPLFQMFHDYHAEHHMSLILRTAISLTLYDELYMELVRQNEKYPVGRHNRLLALEWLNPLGMSFDDIRGEISRYRYSPMNNAVNVDYEPFEIAYKHGFNPGDDLRGYPDILAVMDSLNIDQNIQASVLSHFTNGIQAQAIISPKEGFGTLNSTREGMQDASKRSRGVENVGGYTYWPRNIEVTPLDYPRYEQITSYSQATIERILDQFGVPKAIIGNSDVSGYKEGDEVTYRFYVANIIPRAKDVAEFFNRQVITKLPMEYQNDRLMVDSSEFDRVSENDEKEADLAIKNLQAGIITVNQALKRQGIEELPEENGELLMLPVGTIMVSPAKLVDGLVVGMAPDEAVATTAAIDGEDPGDLPPDGSDPAGGTGMKDTITEDLEKGLISLGAAMEARGRVVPPAQSELLFRLYKIDGKTIPIEQLEQLEQPEEPPMPEGGASAKSLPAPFDLKWTVEAAQKELDNWYRFITNRKKGLKHMGDFVLKYTRGTIADELTSVLTDYDKETAKHTVKWYFEEAKRKLTIKAIQATRIDFEDDFEDALKAFIDGKLDRTQWSRNVRSMIRKANNKAFRDGLGDGGAEGEEPDDSEQVELNQFIRAQAPYVTDLGARVKGGAATTYKGRGQVWFNKSVKPMYQKGLGSSAGNRMAEWVLGKTETHCKSCKGYNGQRHRYNVWERIGAMPQSDTLACHGDNCDCELVFVRGKARGKLFIIKMVKNEATKMYVTKAELKALTETKEKAAYAYVSLGERDELLSVQRSVKDALSGASGITWESPETFHVTLVYAPDISDQELDDSKMDSIDGFKLAENPLKITKVGVFETPGGQALHLVVDPNLSLLSLQAWVHDEFKGVELSEYSNPDGYNPHITLAYVPNGVVIPDIEIAPFELGVDRLVYGRDEYEEIHVIETDQRKSKAEPEV